MRATSIGHGWQSSTRAPLLSAGQLYRRAGRSGRSTLLERGVDSLAPSGECDE